MEALVSVEALAERLPFELGVDDLREARGALEDLSDEARLYGKKSWTTPANTPRAIQNLILRAASRHMKNPDGYTTSRAGDETVAWNDARGEDAGTACFTKREIDAIRQIAGVQEHGFHSVGLFAFTDRPAENTGYVPVEDGSRPFPYYAGDGPW